MYGLETITRILEWLQSYKYESSNVPTPLQAALSPFEWQHYLTHLKETLLTVCWVGAG
jgi:hypothetical protein